MEGIDLYQGTAIPRSRRRARVERKKRAISKAKGDREKLIMANVIVYSTPLCVPCDQLKSYLRERGVDFTAKDLMMDEDAAKCGCSGRKIAVQFRLDW